LNFNDFKTAKSPPTNEYRNFKTDNSTLKEIFMAFSLKTNSYTEKIRRNHRGTQRKTGSRPL
jgi:hypothetical protein